ncbi:S-layer homology domain-containing protein [Solibacillus sp. FSL K6-1554]|uniref:S-layer homology domain-containing protein n=1 Tax=Solibacillus sp. FSL K6-1554 TaxID=2921472 RepID=UPI0030F746D4
MTRAQLASMIARALNLGASEKATPFTDTVGKWYEKDVQALYEAGMISGTDANAFAGDKVLTRQQAALMLNQVIEKHGKLGTLQTAVKGDNSFAKLPTFADRHKIADNAIIAVARLENAGIVTGDDGHFNPQNELTRAQIAKMLAGVLELTGNM